jgi:uncharacterized beta-barrel protein YwiB (DUF1934 family)
LISREFREKKWNVVRQLKKDVWIKIKGIQTVDGEQDTTELYTQGRYYEKNGCYYITYEETETTGFDGCRTILKVEGDRRVSLMRSGPSRTNLLLEKDERNVGYYGTSEGELMIGVSAHELHNSLGEHGGEVYFRYSLDVNASHISDNEVYVTIGETVQ